MSDPDKNENMIRNYITTTIRNIRKNILFFILNSLGLAIGIMVTIFIVSWIIDELNYDRYNAKHEKIFRLERHIVWRDFNLEMPITSGPYQKVLLDVFPEIVNSTRVYPQEVMIKDSYNIYRKQNTFFVDDRFLHMFSLSFIHGDTSVLKEPNSIVLTQQMAQKYFGKDYAIGRTIKMQHNNQEYNLKVTGIIHKVPSNSHFHPEMLISISTLYPGQKSVFDDWLQNMLYTYIELDTPESSNDLIKKFPDLLKTQVGPRYANILDDGEDINDMIELKIKKLSDIHLHSQLEFELEKNGNITLVYLFGAVALLILIIASINYINLSTAKGESRSLEIGIRKVTGARKKHLVFQFILESFIITFASFLLALTFAELFSPFYANITGKEFSWIFFTQFKYLLLLIGIVLFTGLFAGIYPAFFLTRFNPISVLKSGTNTTGKKGLFRMVLVIFQFFISISFVILSILIFFQLELIQNKDIGYDKNNILVVPVENNNELAVSYESFKDDLLTKPSVYQNITSASALTSSHMYETISIKKLGESDPHSSVCMDINYDFTETLKLSLLAGRDFIKEFSDTSHNRIIINETALRNLGWENSEDAIGEHVEIKFNTDDLSKQGEIIGVVKDFHFKSMHQKIEPLVFQLKPKKLSYIYLRINPKEKQVAIEYLKNLWINRFPETEFNYFFLTDILNNQYANEHKLKDKLMISTVLSILIACLGLLGLSLFIIKQKTKEIGIRKVLGASISSIVKKLSSNYLKWIGISTLLAWPVSYWIMNKWLQAFSVKINLLSYWWVFFLAGIVAALLSLIVISVQTIKYASINPAESLKYE